jgi:hypothetical protein
MDQPDLGYFGISFGGRLIRQGLALQELNMNEHFRIHHHANDISNLC